MEYIDIPNVRNKASRIGLGTWSIGGWMWGGTDENQAIKTIHHALDLGINLIDTAPVYGFGKSEEIVGKALKQYRGKNNFILATKAGLNWKKGAINRDARKERLIDELEQSLRRLQVDHIAIYQLHWPDTSTPIQETAETFGKMLKEGKIGAIGVSNLSIEQMEEFQRYAPIHVLQPPFNMFEREVEDKELTYCLQKKIATLGYGSLCRGLLSGKIAKHKKFEGDDLRKVDPKFQEPLFSEYLQATEKLENWSQAKYKKPLLALALRFVIDKGISVALWGARHPEQLDELNAVWNWRLTPEDMEEIDHILQESIPTPVGPGFMAPSSR